MRIKIMIRTLEEYSLNALPAMNTYMYDGWLLRFANGYTKRANSVNPLYPSNENPLIKIAECERLYAARKLATIFKLTPVSIPDNLDSLLVHKGYRLESPASVQILELPNISSALDGDVFYSSDVTEDWLQFFLSCNEMTEKEQTTLYGIWANILLDKYFITIKSAGKTIGCGLGVLHKDYLGIFDIKIDQVYRKKGYGGKLVENLLKLGVHNGAKKAYLQVLLRNDPALHLYAKLGFKEQYQYWYRVKDY